jgi:predicted DNA-binding transcriptional regulator YafY
MNRIDRLVAMVMYLQGRRVVRAEEMAEHFEVTVRTVYRDIGALGEAGVPISGEAGVGYSLVKGYHLPPVMFTAEEAMALFIGGEMVKRFADASLAAPMESALLKIRSVLPRERQDDLDRLGRATAIIGAPRLPSGIDQRTLLPIQQAIVARRVLRMSYRARTSEEATVREVEPLGVMYHSGAWYLVAWCRLRGALRHFKLERLHRLEVLREQFPARASFSLHDHLKGEIDSVQKLMVRVRFATPAVERARRESLAGFTTEQPVEGGVEVEMMTFSYDWLARWLLSFGSDAEALEPEELRASLRSEAEALVKRYAGESSARTEFSEALGR